VEFNLADLFESAVDHAGPQTVMVSGARRLSYTELDHRANRLAHYFERAGIGPGDRVGLQLANGTEYIEGMLACFKIRAVPINVNYRYAAGELQYLYKDAALVGLIFHSRFAPAVTGALGAMPETRALLEVSDSRSPGGLADDYESAIGSAPPIRDFPPRRADDLYCVYTGGTTGIPKGVLWRHEDIFFTAMGGGDPFSLGNHITSPEELAERVLHPGLTALAIPPFMHAAGHWLAFSTMSPPCSAAGRSSPSRGVSSIRPRCGGWWRQSRSTRWSSSATPWPARCSTSWWPIPAATTSRR
jgi:acyl-CoA synthetase (AMP-forming)/AMP-acid ligase II